MDITLKNLRIQKKYLENITSLQQFKAYQNHQMEFLRAKTRKLVKKIEETRFKESNYQMFISIFNILFYLDVIEEELSDDICAKVDHHDFIHMFGAEAAGPNLIVSFIKGKFKNTFKIYYNDDGTELKREQHDAL